MKIERRTTGDVEEIRVVVDLIWDRNLDSTGGCIAEMRSDWVPEKDVAKSQIAEIFNALKAQAASGPPKKIRSSST